MAWPATYRGMVALKRIAFITPLLLSQPFFARDTGLPQDTTQQANSYVAFVGIWNDDSQVAASHLGVPATCQRSFETKFAHPVHELAP